MPVKTTLLPPDNAGFRSPQNGEIYTAIPQKILLFKAPSPLPPKGQAWLDSGDVRHFSAEFYAELLRDMGVTLVVGLGSIDYDHRPFERVGISLCTVDDLGCQCREERLSFQVGDSFPKL